jgi:hypothetical protein
LSSAYTYYADLNVIAYHDRFFFTPGKNQHFNPP